jgi:HEAT repeat protein
LREELNRTRDFRTRRGPHLQRSQVVSSLERAVRGFQRHGRREMIEALLLVADRRNAAINHVLGDPSDRAFAPLLELLVASPRPRIMELLLDCLDDPQTPLAALHAVMRRRDARFVRLLCRRIGASPAVTIRNNLKRVDQVPLMRQPSALLQMLDPDEQPGSVQLAQCSNLPRHQALEYVDRVLQKGSISGRRCAAVVLASMEGAQADAICQRTLADDDGEVKAAVARQLREREIPGAVQLLVELLLAPLPDVRQAARDALADITFERYLDGYDQSDDETRLAEGQLTLQVDSNFIGKLVMELQSSSRTHQRRGLEITLLLGLASQVEPTLAELAQYDDQYVRLEAIRLLAAMGTPLARGILRAAMHDKSALVQEAARQGLPDFDTAGSDLSEASAAIGNTAETAVREAVL